MPSKGQTKRSIVLKFIMVLSALFQLVSIFVKHEKLKAGQVEINLISLLSVLILSLTVYQSIVEAKLICNENLSLRDELRSKIRLLESDARAINISIVLPEVSALNDSSWNQNRYATVGFFVLLLIVSDFFIGSGYLTSGVIFVFMIMDYFANQTFEGWTTELRTTERVVISTKQEVLLAIVENLRKEIHHLRQENQQITARLNQIEIIHGSVASSESNEEGLTILGKFFEEMTSKAVKAVKAVKGVQELFEAGSQLEMPSRR